MIIVAWVISLLFAGALLDIASYFVSFKEVFPLPFAGKIIVYTDAVIVTGVLIACRTGVLKIR